MNKRPITYILSFLLLFAVLVGMQVYFLINSYALKEREIVESVRSKLKNLEDDRDIFNDDYMKNKSYMKIFMELDEGKVTEDSLRNFYSNRSQHISTELKKYVDSLFSDLGYHVAVKKELISLHSNSTNKELLKDKITIYESIKEEGQVNYLSSGTWEMNYTESNSETEGSKERITEDLEVVNYGFLVSRKSTFTISNIYWLLFKELLLFVVASLLILTAILYIFYVTYKNLLKQSKQVVVLHDMVDNVSHEMRTPIATLKLASKNLQNNFEDSSFAILDRQILRLEKLLEPLTDSDANQELTDYNYSDIKLLLDDLRNPNNKSIIVLSTFPKQSIRLNKVSFETILSNLVINSIKYGASKVNLSVELNEEVLHLKVQDDGQGIDVSEIPYIFEKFYRVQKDNIHNNKGLGLGLYIVKQLVNQFKGDIKVKTQLNKGSEFLIVLPYDK